ncbi:MAG TPA: DUF4058 family protein [Gemmataceae bacterium]|nr:DUF4058 family protein [Gemmataceae bacterium]
MRSPFPGMDPYIEACGLWEDFHGNLIHRIAESLADTVPQRYLVRTGERSYIVLVESQAQATPSVMPDVSVTAPHDRKKPTKKSGSAVAEPAGEMEPVEMRAFIEEEHREAFVEIFAAGPEQRLVTTLEVLSPANKRPNTPGWELYQRKRQSALLGGVNLVEIDLLRGGQRMPMLDPWPASPYTLLVARAKKAQLCKAWPAHFRRPLPVIPVPLAKPDPDVALSLQPLIEAIYQRFRYERSIDYTTPLTTPLGPEEAAWLEQQLRTRAGHKS